MRFFKQTIKTLVRISDSPERTALAFSIGVALGFSPLIGLHTFLGIAIALIFRFNKVALLAGVWSNLPWIAVPYYGFATWVGIVLLGIPEGRTPPKVGLSELFSLEFWAWLFDQWWLLLPAVVGSTVLCLLLAGLSYPLTLLAIRRYRGIWGDAP